VAISTIEWDVKTDEPIADPMMRWGEVVSDRLPLSGDGCVLGAACGAGRFGERLFRSVTKSGHSDGSGMTHQA